MDLEQKIKTNTWDHFDDALAVLEAARAGKWWWCNNTRCKYIELRIDMRDGACIIKDRDGNRIDPADLRSQFGPGGGLSWADMDAFRNPPPSEERKP